MTPTDAVLPQLTPFLPEPQTAAELSRDPAELPALRLSEPTPTPAPAARVPRAEPLTPFVAWTLEARTAGQARRANAEPTDLFDGFLHHPGVIIDHLLAPKRVPALVITSAAITAACAALYEGAIVTGFHLPSLRPVLVGPLMVLLAEAAAVGPIYAASVMAAARVPVARLGAAILAATATGALLLAALAPALYVIIDYDRQWLGPLAMVAAFALAGLASGRRLYRLLLGMAERLYQHEAGPTARLLPADAERAALVARLACLAVGFTLSLACWTSSAP